MGALLSEPVAAVVVERASTHCWAAATATMQGWRRTHEDAHVLQCSAGGVEEAAVFAVLDGHGGQVCAHVGSRDLEERLVGLARKGSLQPKAAEEELTSAFKAVDVHLRQALGEDRSGSTVVAAIVTQPRPAEYCVQMAHAGDSRAVLCTGGGKQLVATEDHKPQREDETRRIKAAGGSVEHGALGGGPLRVDGALAVSRAFGDFHFKPAEMAPELTKVTAVPEVRTVQNCSAGDWLLLACDGVFDVMENEDVHQFIQSRLSGSADLGVIARELLMHCLEKGSKDNCTACIVQFKAGGSSEAKPTPNTRELLQGPWRTASPDVQAKYADFFAAEGFKAEAAALKESAGTSSSASGGGQGSDIAAGPGGGAGKGAGGGPAQIAKLAKALQAMRASRTIQTAWRRNSQGAASPSGASAGAAAGAAAPADAGASAAGVAPGAAAGPEGTAGEGGV